MGKLFGFDSPLGRFFVRLFDLMLLNLLWLLCCIPVVTIGAATSALYYVTMRLQRDECTGVLRDFFGSFRNHFGQSVAITAVYLLSGAAILASLYMFSRLDMGAAGNLRYVLIVAFAVHFALFTYVFPLFARYDNTVKNTLKNAYMLAIRYPVNTLVAVAVRAVPFALLIFLPDIFFLFGIVWLLVGFALIAYINAGFFRRVFQQLDPPDADEE